jgi:hypothetical protein
MKNAVLDSDFSVKTEIKEVVNSLSGAEISVREY